MEHTDNEIGNLDRELSRKIKDEADAMKHKHEMLSAEFERTRGRQVFRAGKHFWHLDSSFLAEAMSMEWALEVLITTLLGERAPLR